MHVYYDFFHDICSSQYEYMSISLKLNNITFQSQKKDFERIKVIFMIVESSSRPPKIISCPHFGDASPGLKTGAY